MKSCEGATVTQLPFRIATDTLFVGDTSHPFRLLGEVFDGFPATGCVEDPDSFCVSVAIDGQ